ncbi:MAG: porin [Rhodospirillales bacterium]|nr:porin [Rhodospirillales bacterium]
MSISQFSAVARRGVVVGAVCTACIAVTAGSVAAQEMPSPEEMWQVIQEQQREIEALKERIGAGEAVAEETAMAVEAVVESIDAGTTGAGWWDRTQIGGYGELHYNIKENSQDRVDFHRYVLFFGHDFNATTRMFSEFELEHSLAGEGKPGEVELEQAYIERDFSDSVIGRAGIMLMPIGLLNEVHEPPTFYGVERNRIENVIVPTTWWEAGVSGTMTTEAGVQVDVMLHSGLDVPTDSFKIRSGRGKVANHDFEEGAVTGRIRYTGMPGVELAAALQHQADLTQGDDASGTLIVANAAVTRPISESMSLGLRALYAGWDIDGDDAAALGADSQNGWYLEPSVRMALGGDESVGFFARYETWDTRAGNSADTEENQWVVGVNYWLHPNAVLKADYVTHEKPGSDDAKTLSLGVGYQF